MAKCPICGKNKSNKKDLLEHIETSHKDEIPSNMTTAQYVYSLNHGRAYGICRVCGKPTPWNEKTGKPKQICGSDICKKKVSKEFEENLKAKYNKTREGMLNDPERQQQMLANRKISGTYKWSDHKHLFTYTGSYEKYALEWLDTIMDMDPETIQMPGPIVQYTFEGKLHYWITDMYLSDYNLVIEIKDGNATGNKNTHPGFSHNRDLEKAKDEYMKSQNQYNYIKLTNKNMMQLVKTLSQIRLNNIFSVENNKVEPIIDINESIIYDVNLMSDNVLNEAIIVEKLTGQLKELHLKIVEYIKDVSRKWQNIQEIKVSKNEKQTLLNIIKLSSKLMDFISEILKTGKNISYETTYEEFLSEIKKFKKYRNNDDEKNELVNVDMLQRHVSIIEKKFKESSKIDTNIKFNKKYKTALYIVMSRTLYAMNLTLYNATGKASGGSFRSDKSKGIVSKRYGKSNMSFNMKKLDNSEVLDILNEMRKSTNYSSYKKIFDSVVNLYGKKDVSALKFLDMEKYNKLVFLSYGKLKPMVLKKGTKLYHISSCETIKALNPVYKCRDNITFYSTPRVYFTDKLMDPKKVLPNVDTAAVYEYEITKDTTAYRDNEYGSWYHHCLYIESNHPLTVKNITKEVLETKNESYEFDNYDYELLNENISDKVYIDKIDEKKIEKDISKIYTNYKRMDQKEKENNLINVLHSCQKVISYISGIGFISEGRKDLKENKRIMRQIKTDMPMNHETYNKINRSINTNAILKIVLGILIIVLNTIIIGKLSFKSVGRITFSLMNNIEKINGKSNNTVINTLCKNVLSTLSKILNANIINESYELYDIVDIDSYISLNEEYNFTNISNEDIESICEGTYEYNDNKIGVLEEVSFPIFFSNKKNNDVKSQITPYSTYDIKQHTWKDLLFPKNNFTKKVSSVFHKVEVNDKNHTIEIRGINYRRLIQHIKDLYDNQKVYKIFEIIYNSKDWDKYANKKIDKNSVRIEYIQTYEFFALELSILFKELYKKYKLTYYDDICTEIYNKTWLSNSDVIKPENIDIDALKLLNDDYELKLYQREFIELYPILKAKLNLNGYILSFDQGLGKTLTSIALALCLRKDKIYIVCPNTLKENWALEIKSYFPKYENKDFWEEEVYISGISKNYDPKKVKFIIVNQESIPKIFDTVDTKTNNMLIIDESHNFRNINSARSLHLIKLRDMLKTKDVLVMSGTPIKASPNEICPTLRLIDPLFTDEVAEIYNKCFNLNDIIASNIIQTRFGKIMYRKTKDEVLQLPKKTIQTLKVKVTNEDKYYVDNVRSLIRDRAEKIFKTEYKDYDDLKNEFHNLINKYSTSSKSDIDRYLKIIDDNIPNYAMHEIDVQFKKEYLDKYVYPTIVEEDKDRLNYLLVRFVNMWQHCIGIAIGEILYPRRKEMFIKLYEDNKSLINDMIFDNVKKTVIFTPIVEVANYIHKALGKAGISSVLVTGNVKDKLTPIMRFKEDSNVDVLVATTQTLGTGVTLTEANLMFFFGTPWRSTDFDQCCDRIYRIGQTTDVFIFNVLMDSEKLNLSTRMENILDWSNKMFGSVITSTDNETIKNLNENSSNESVMSIANLSPIIKTGLFEELEPNENNEDFDKQLEILKKSLNESLEDIKTINPKDYCPEEIDFNNLPEDRFLMNRVKADIINKTAVTVTVDRHYGNLYVASDFHVFGVWDKNDNNNNATNIQQVNVIIDDINSKVKEDDTLIICGDLGYKLDDCLLQHTKYFLQSIRCKHIWLVLGNHDLLTNEQYKEFGCEIVCDRLEYNGWIFTHYPISTNKFNFYAHLHDGKISDKNEDYKNISINNRFDCLYHTKGITKVNDVIQKYMNNNKTNITSINEEAIYNNTYKYPVFIVLMHSGTFLADAIKKFTHDDYSHACISLTPDLIPMYSFGRKKVELKDGTGFSISSPTDPFFKKFKAVYGVYVMYLSKNEYDNIKKRLQYFIDNKDTLKYNISALIMNALNKSTENSKKYFCSRFVADVLNAGRELDKLPSLYRPNDFAYRTDITLVNYGTDISKYNKYITEKNLKLIQRGQYKDIILSETSLKNSDVMFGNGEYSSITDNRFTDFQTGNPFEQNEDIDPYTATFSPNNTKPIQDYMDPSNNFETNEDVRVDMEIDPGITSPSDMSSIAQSIYSNNFEI